MDLTPEEIAALQAKAAKADEIEKAKTELEGKVKEYEEDKNIMDWRKVREKEKRMIAELQKAGKTLDEDGNVVEVSPKAMAADEVRRLASEEAERLLISKSLNRVKKDLNEEDQKIFDKYYEKATHGETVDAENVDTFIEDAMRMAGKPYSGSRSPQGGPPVMQKADEGFGATPEGQDLAARMGIKI